MTTASAGRSGAANSPAGEADGGPADDSNGDDSTDGGPSAPAKPSGPVIAACMGRDGEAVCDRMKLIMCGEQGTGDELDTCDTVAQCKAGLATGTCGVCDPGKYQCTDADLEVCGMTGQWEVQETCPTAALCSDANHTCDPSKCAPDAVKCDSGMLLGCNMDQTDFEPIDDCMDEKLCDEANKRCNECVPDSMECDPSGDPIVLKCSADGKGPAKMPCMAPTGKCLDGACIQCVTKDDCMPSGECMEVACNDHMCSEQPKPRDTSCSGGGKCDALGQCAACLVGGDDCPADQRCITGVGCVDASPLETSISLGNRFSVRLNAGWGAEITVVKWPMEGTSIRIENELFSTGGRIETNTLASSNATHNIRLTNEVRNFVVAGPMGAASGVCPVFPTAGDELTLEFEGPAAEDGGMGEPCGYASVKIRATMQP